MRAFVAAVLLGAAVLPAGDIAAQDFEGVITIKTSGMSRDGQPSPDIEYMSRGGRMRVNVRSPMGSMGMIAVPAEKKMFMLMEQQRMYMEMPMQLDGRSGTTRSAEPTVTRTGRKETIAGYECEHLTIASGTETSDVCVAKGLGTFLTTMPGATRGMPAWQRQLIAEGAFPLKVVSANGTSQLEVTKIEKRKLSPALFDVPDDYTKMDMPRRPPGRP